MSEENQAAAAAAPQASTSPPAGRRRARRILLHALLGVVLLAGLAWGVWYLLDGRWYEQTDDAYVQGNVVQVTPRVPGTVVRIAADDNDFVQQGQPLVLLDTADADVALAQARAALGQAVRQVSSLYSTAQTARAEVAVSETAAGLARADFQRRRKLASTGAIASEELTHAQAALAQAESTLAAARARLATSEAQVAGTEVATHPDVQAAAARLREAWLNYRRMVLPAPVTGHVAKRSVQVGQHVQPGTPLMAVVPLSGVWVDANFKETQLRHMRLGQAVTLKADLYGGGVTYHGQVVGLGVGTGSAFSLLPAQNATGNWIKIVQRLAVRIRLDDDELKAHPLRIGLSMDARVDLHDRSGAVLSDAPAADSVSQTSVYEDDETELGALIADIIARNSAAVPAPAGKTAAGS